MPSYDTMAANRLADERGSVHSGRSSANGEGIKERFEKSSRASLKRS